MEDSSNKSHHEPWNKGKLVGQKAPFKLKESGPYACDCSSNTGSGNWPCLTWVSTVS
jgi:hypothetical protein